MRIFFGENKQHAALWRHGLAIHQADLTVLRIRRDLSFDAVKTGHVAITPIQVDLTRYSALEKVASWVGGLTETLGRPE